MKKAQQFTIINPQSGMNKQVCFQFKPSQTQKSLSTIITRYSTMIIPSSKSYLPHHRFASCVDMRWRTAQRKVEGRLGFPQLFLIDLPLIDWYNINRIELYIYLHRYLCIYIFLHMIKYILWHILNSTIYIYVILYIIFWILYTYSLMIVLIYMYMNMFLYVLCIYV